MVLFLCNYIFQFTTTTDCEIHFHHDNYVWCFSVFGFEMLTFTPSDIFVSVAEQLNPNVLLS